MKRGKERNQKEKRKEKTFSFGVFGYRMERKEEVMNTFVWFTFSNFMINIYIYIYIYQKSCHISISLFTQFGLKAKS